jgi:hypothetical protein
MLNVLRLAMVLEYLLWSQAIGRAEPGHTSDTSVLACTGMVDRDFMPMAQRMFGEGLPQ